MADSKLVDVEIYSGGFYKGRYDSAGKAHKLERITPHHVAGVMTAEGIGNYFAPRTRKASPTYGIGNDGKICQCVKEEDTPWTTSSRANDCRAITFEISNSKHGDAYGWPISDAAYESTIALMTDICQRYNKDKLVWIPDKSKSLSYVVQDNELLVTIHQWFSATACPGPFLLSHMEDIVSKVNYRLRQTAQPEPWYAPAVAWCKAEGLMVGDTRPLDPLSRAEMAQILFNLHNKKGII